jgi:Fe-S-cluster containining protein
MNKHNAFAHYTQLLSKVDAIFAAAMSNHRDQFQCGAGCYSCCLPGLSTTNIESAYIKDWLSRHEEVREKISSRENMLNDLHQCSMLNDRGECSIYEARPLICRSHGMPISFDGDHGEERDCCPLNFVSTDLNSLSGSDVLSIDKTNMVLSVIDRAYDEENAGQRTLIGDLV